MSDISQAGKDALVQLAKARDEWIRARDALQRAEREEESTRRKLTGIETSLMSMAPEASTGISVVMNQSGRAALVTVTSKCISIRELPTVEVP